MEVTADPAKKVSLCPPSKVLTPEFRPLSLTFPRRRAVGPAGPAWSLALWAVAPTAPLTPFLLLLLFQGRLGATRRKSRPSPLPPAGSGAEGPSRPLSRAVSQRRQPHPHLHQAPPPWLQSGPGTQAGSAHAPR